MTRRKPSNNLNNHIVPASVEAESTLKDVDSTAIEKNAMNPDGLKLLVEADLLLNEGLKRIAGAGRELPEACSPIEEALALSETQTLNTLESLDTIQEAIHRIEATEKGFIDDQVHVIKTALNTILSSQQGQDLAGQRLKKALILLNAVNERISQAILTFQENLGIPQNNSEENTLEAAGIPIAKTDAVALEEAIQGQHVEQDDVDALLAELGI